MLCYIIIVVFTLFSILCGLIATYYDAFSSNPVIIKGYRLRLGNYFDKYVIEKHYFPGIWLQVRNRRFEVPSYITEVTPDMKTLSDGPNNIRRTTEFPETTDKALAEKEFNRINSYTSREKYEKYKQDMELSDQGNSEETVQPAVQQPRKKNRK